MPVPRPVSVAACLAVLLLVASCGSDDDSASSPSGDSSARTVEIEMRDIEFSPTTVDVEEGETIRFLFRNTGEVAHEAYIGDAAAPEEHADEMESMGGMDHGGDAEVLTVEPGDSGELLYTFDEAGPVQIGCHEPGHYEAGMVIDVEVG
jgi:uncharacterized cupredoxin-like copper-binding protein